MSINFICCDLSDKRFESVLLFVLLVLLSCFIHEKQMIIVDRRSDRFK